MASVYDLLNKSSCPAPLSARCGANLGLGTLPDSRSATQADLSTWLLQERDKLLRYRKQRKKMAKLPKVKEGEGAGIKRKHLKPV